MTLVITHKSPRHPERSEGSSQVWYTERSIHHQTNGDIGKSSFRTIRCVHVRTPERQTKDQKAFSCCTAVSSCIQLMKSRGPWHQLRSLLSVFLNTWP